MNINDLKTLMMVTLITFSVTAVAGSNRDSSGAPSVNIPVTDLKYFDTGISGSNGLGTLQVAPGFGDLNKGAHGTFVKMPAGFVSQLHTHTDDYYAVVISGVGVNTALDGKEIALPVGSYWLQKGKEPHVTKCISSNECIFFINQTAKFDNIPGGAEMH